MEAKVPLSERREMPLVDSKRERLDKGSGLINRELDVHRFHLNRHSMQYRDRMGRNWDKNLGLAQRILARYILLSVYTEESHRFLSFVRLIGNQRLLLFQIYV